MSIESACYQNHFILNNPSHSAATTTQSNTSLPRTSPTSDVSPRIYLLQRVINIHKGFVPHQLKARDILQPGVAVSGLNALLLVHAELDNCVVGI